MSKSTPEKRAHSPADRLDRQLHRLLSAQSKQLKNEDTVRLGKNGEHIRESVRTVAVPASDACETGPALNNFPDTPNSQENGKVFDHQQHEPAAQAAPVESPQDETGHALDGGNLTDESTDLPAAHEPISFHEPATAGKEIAPPAATDAADPLEELLARALSRPRRGRPAAFDERNKGQLVALLSLGMSLRQAAAVLGVSHTTIRNTLQADATLAEEITAARFQAQLQPLACVIREARRSWKAATWLLKYLDYKIATHEETPDERRARQQRETDEFFAHARARK